MKAYSLTKQLLLASILGLLILGSQAALAQAPAPTSTNTLVLAVTKGGTQKRDFFKNNDNVRVILKSGAKVKGKIFFLDSTTLTITPLISKKPTTLSADQIVEINRIPVILTVARVISPVGLFFGGSMLAASTVAFVESNGDELLLAGIVFAVIGIPVTLVSALPWLIKGSTHYVAAKGWRFNIIDRPQTYTY